MANDCVIIVKEQDIIKSFQYYRLKKEIELFEKKKNIAESKIDHTATKNPFTKLKNAINNKKSDNRSEDISKVQKFIDRFEIENANINYKLCVNGGIEGALCSLYNNDKYGLQKIMLGVSLVLDNSFDYTFETEEYEEISRILFNDFTKMSEIKKTLKSNYTDIASKSLSNLQKGILIGLGIGGLVLACSLPIVIAGGASVSAAVTTSSLATLGFGDMQLGIGMAALFGLIGGSALVGLGYGAIKANNTFEAKESFRKLNCDEAALLLAIKALLIKEAKLVMPNSEFKDYLNEILEAIELLKSDSEYMLFVENRDVKTNKGKVDIFYNWNKKLINIMNL